jgi:hypothetical protein
MVRSSRRSSRAGGLLVLAAVLAVVTEVSAHRRDEYLQAARLAIDPARVEIELDLTPGIALADAILADIDRDHDVSLSADEHRAYRTLVLSALELEVDGTRLKLEPGASRFPGIDEVRRGEGTIRLHFTATLPRLSAGVHQLSFRNTHERSRSVYLANALVPQSHQVTIAAQRRDVDQTELTIDYVLRQAPAGSTAVWLVAGLALATALSAVLMRPLRALR